MSGGLFARAAAREIGRPLSPAVAETIQRRHGEIYREILPERRPLPGAVELLADLRAERIVHGIATSGRRPEIDASLEALGVGDKTVVVERGDVERAKPEPDLFVECARRRLTGLPTQPQLTFAGAYSATQSRVRYSQNANPAKSR